MIIQGSHRVRVDLAHVKTVIAAMGDAAADLATRPYRLPREAQPDPRKGSSFSTCRRNSVLDPIRPRYPTRRQIGLWIINA